MPRIPMEVHREAREIRFVGGESNYLSATLIHPHAFLLLIRDQWYNPNHIRRTI